MSVKIRAEFEELRSIAFGGISGVYASLGTPINNSARILYFLNITDSSVLVTDDITKDKLVLPANGGFFIVDLMANSSKEAWGTQKGKQYYVKELDATTTSGSVYLTVMY